MRMLFVGFLVGLSTLAVSATEPASPSVQLDALRRVPILENGRKMPLDTYARYTLLQFSGRSRAGNEEAIAWLARLLFQPETVAEVPVFLVNHPEAVQALGIPAEGRDRYAMRTLEPSLLKLEELARNAAAMPADDQSLVDRELIHLYGNVLNYFDLSNALAFARPNPDFVVRQPEVREILGLGPEEGPYRFLDIYGQVHKLQPSLEPLMNREPATWSPFEQEVFQLSQALFRQSQAYQANSVPLLPVAPHGEETWLAPWDVLAMGLRDQASMNAVLNLQHLTTAFAEGDQDRFDRAAGDLILFAQSRLPGDRELRMTGLEVLFNRLKLFRWSMVGYLLAFLLSFAAVLTTRPGLRRSAAVLLWVAVIPHTAGMVMRMMIMGRPPVTNLYATFLFVAWVCVLLGWLMELFQRNAFGTLTAAFCGAVLILVAGRFSAENDTMGKVVAVLDSNFWLTTHVLSITIGYAGCVAAGLVGHLYLLTAALRPGDVELHRSVSRSLFGVLGFGLLFSFLGTMLGGVWADQSWGRFWGWDPKENGALLIVLWCAVLFHARLGRMIQDVGMAAGAALGVIIVMLAWLGVNLLGVGLHSYGFTSGLARALVTYIVLQVALVAILVPWARVRLAHAAPRSVT